MGADREEQFLYAIYHIFTALSGLPRSVPGPHRLHAHLILSDDENNTGPKATRRYTDQHGPQYNARASGCKKKPALHDITSATRRMHTELSISDSFGCVIQNDGSLSVADLSPSMFQHLAIGPSYSGILDLLFRIAYVDRIEKSARKSQPFWNEQF